ncbi:MAG: right-handed parallel beta-helix repeat-containing protein [Verrucomicrobiota bacterium]
MDCYTQTRLTCFLLVCLLGSAASITEAETITISSSSTSSEELPAAVAETIEHFTKLSAESYELILEGKFSPPSTIRIQWWGDKRLTVSGSALFNGSALPEASETVFAAGKNLTVKGLRFVNSKGHALVVGGGSETYEILNCHFDQCRQGAIHVWNDPHTITMETSQRGIIRGNRINGFNLKGAKWANDGITVFDQRVTIAENFISNSPTECNGIRAMGPDLIIERNVVKGVSIEDSGGIYLWGGPHASLFRGSVVRWNHIIGASRGIYLDDGTSGVRVEENVVENSSFCAIFLSGGRDNVVKRNVVDETPVFLHLDSRCLAWDSRPEYADLAKESVTRVREALAKEDTGKILRARYRALRDLGEKDLTLETYGVPKNNRVEDNFVRNAKEIWELMDFSSTVTTEFQTHNSLSEPETFEKDIDLKAVCLRENFGFSRLDQLRDLNAKNRE